MPTHPSCSRRAALGALGAAGLAALLPTPAPAAPEARAGDPVIRAEEGGRAGQPDRYHIEIPGRMLTRPTSRLRFDLSMFSAHGGRVTSGGVKLFARPTGPGDAPAEISLQSVGWDQRGGALSLAVAKAIPPGTALDLVVDVTNPEKAGSYHFKGMAHAPGSAAAWHGLAVWTVEIEG